MFLFKLLSLNDRSKTLRRWLKDPAKEARSYVNEIIYGYVSTLTIVAVVTLGILAVLGFTSLIGGPHQAAEVLFYFALGIFLIIGLVLWTIWRKVKKIADRLSDAYRGRTARNVKYDIKEDVKKLEDES